MGQEIHPRATTSGFALCRPSLDFVYKKPKKIAVFTHVYNEDIFIDIFIRHYKNLVNDWKDIYIIDHGSEFKSKHIDNYPVQLIDIPRGELDHLNIKKYCENFQRFLLQQYDWVIHVDVDELLIHRNGMDYLRENIINSKERKVIKPKYGMELIFNPSKEKTYEISKPITLQRRYGKYNSGYAKPVLASIPTTWGLGFHFSLDDDNVHEDEDLYLIHLADISIEERIRRNLLWRKNGKTSTESDKKSTPQDNRTIEYDELINYYKNIENKEKIPEWMIGLF